MATTIKQGDAYMLPIRLRADGALIPADNVTLIEVYFGRQRHLWPGDMSYENGVLEIPLSQEETFLLRGDVDVDIRMKLNSGDVHGLPNPLRVSVRDAVSREVL